MAKILSNDYQTNNLQAQKYTKMEPIETNGRLFIIFIYLFIYLKMLFGIQRFIPLAYGDVHGKFGAIERLNL